MSGSHLTPAQSGAAPRPGTPLILCADDFGYGAGVNRGIVALAARQRLSAVSCITIGGDFRASAPELAELEGALDIGLHLTLTELGPAGPMPALAPDGRFPAIGELLRQAYRGKLAAPEIRDEILRQLEGFRTAFGRNPDFLDGHQHVHLLPTVRDAVLALFEMRELHRAHTYLRDCHEPAGAVVARRVAVPKALFLAALGRSLHRAIRRRGLAANDSFRGIYDFDPAADYRALMRRFLRGPGARPLAMCHPAAPAFAPLPGDPIAPARIREFAYLASAAFPEDLAEAGVRLARFGETGTGRA
jgi:predicted glycoside hydrolase/deacetylase ChbG (UPF0249 family)